MQQIDRRTSTIQGVMFTPKQESSIDSIAEDESLPNINIIKGTYHRPHFEWHTQSSLLKTKEIKQYSMSLKKVRKSEGNYICKKQYSKGTRKSKSMQSLKTVLLQEKDPLQTFGFLPDKLARSSKADDQTSEHIQNIQNGTASSVMFLQNELASDTCKFIENHPFVEVRRGSQSQLNDDEFVDHKVKDFFSPENASFSKDRSIEIQILHMDLPNVTYRKPVQETVERVAVQDGDVANVNYLYDLDIDAETTKFVKPIDDTQPVAKDLTSSRKKCVGRNVATTSLPVWKPAGVNKVSTAESSVSLTRKSSRSIVQSVVSAKSQQRSKHLSSIKRAESPNNESKSVLVPKKQSKVSMKENRDPQTDRINGTSKIGESLAETRAKNAKQRGRPSGGTLLKRRRSTKVACLPSNNSVSDKRNNLETPRSRSGSRSRSKSKLQRRSSRLTASKSSSKSQPANTAADGIEFAQVSKRRQRPSEIMSTLKKIINSTIEDDDAIESIVEVSGSEETSNISTVGTQTSPRTKRFVEIECNTMPYKVFCKDSEVSCDLIGSTLLRTGIAPSATEDEQVSEDPTSIHVGPQFTGCDDKTDDDSKFPDTTEKLPISEHEVIEDSEDDVKFESRAGSDSTSTLAETVDTIISRFDTKTEVGDDEVHGGEILPETLRGRDGLMKTSAVEHEESTKRLNDSLNTGPAKDLSPKRSHWTSLSLDGYDASCSDSSEEVVKSHEDNVHRITPEVKADSIPSDILEAFRIATEYARNLRVAVALYNESLMSKEPEKRSRTANEDREAPVPGEDRCCVRGNASLVSCKSGDGSRPQLDTEYRSVTMSEEHYDVLSGRSSSRTRQLELQNFESNSQSSCSEVGQGEGEVVLQSGKTSMNLVRQRSDLMLLNKKPLIRLLVRRTQEDNALEVLKVEELAEDGEEEKNGNETESVTRGYLVPIIYCVLCTLVFWYLQSAFSCYFNQ